MQPVNIDVLQTCVYTNQCWCINKVGKTNYGPIENTIRAQQIYLGEQENLF